MGFEDRDYYRSEGDGGFFAPAGSAIKTLIAVNIGVFLLQVLTTRGGGSFIDQWIAFDPSLVLHGEVWRVFSYPFGYYGGNPLPFLFDMYFLWIFGKTVEQMYGTRELLLFYMASAVAAVLVCLVTALATGASLPVLGSAVPVMAVIVVYAWHHPRTQILLFFLIPVEIWILIVGYVLLNLYYAATSGFAGGMFVAELTAIAVGLLYARSGWRIESLIPAGRPTFRLPKRKPKLRVFEPEPRENLDKKVDEILAKIHSQGEASLTARERKTLQEASRRYKKT
jgi:membrane associated rhomboid family serine protease